MTPFTTAPLTEHLHEVALKNKREFTAHVQSLLVQSQGENTLRMLLDGHRWQEVPGTNGQINVRHIERHPEDPDNKSGCDRSAKGVDAEAVLNETQQSLPHISMFALHPGVKGTFITQYYARLMVTSGAYLANGTLVTAHDRTRSEYHTAPGISIALEALEMTYIIVKYFASFDSVTRAELGASLPQLAERQAAGTDWFSIFPEEPTPSDLA